MIKRKRIWKCYQNGRGLWTRRALEIADRERQLGISGSRDQDETIRKLREENRHLKQQINDLNLQIELHSRTSTREYSEERESYRKRALELTKREQALLEKERETDELHAEALRLNQAAKEKSNEAERILYAKQKYIDDLETTKKRIESREAELNDMERIKEGDCSAGWWKIEAIDKRREQVRLLEEELAKHSESLETRIREADKRDREFLERQEEMDRQFAERVLHGWLLNIRKRSWVSIRTKLLRLWQIWTKHSNYIQIWISLWRRKDKSFWRKNHFWRNKKRAAVFAKNRLLKSTVSLRKNMLNDLIWRISSIR